MNPPSRAAWLRGILAYGFTGLILATTSFADTTITVRSGVGSGGLDSSVTFLLGPSTGDFSHAFTQTDFANAQGGPAAFVVSRNAAWISGLSEDPLAQWIGTNPTAGLSQGNTALYAVKFQIPAPFTSATLTLHYAADDTLAFANGFGGIFINGTAVCTNLIQVGFSQEHTLTCTGVGPLLNVGTNWLYFDDVNEAGAAGLLFSATVTTISLPSINPGGIVNSAGSTSPVAPGGLASVYGAFPVSSTSQATGIPLPTDLSGLTMQFSGISVPLLYASPLQANVQVPWELTGQTQALATATVSNQTSASQTVNLAPFAPGIFVTNAQGQGAILDASYRLVGSSNPAIPGSTDIQIYCTGLGPVTNQPATGAAAPTSPLAQTTTTPIVTIGGVRAQVLFSGLTPTLVGLYQVNVLVPAGAPSGNSVPVLIQMGGATSNTATIALQSAPTPNPQPTITGLSPVSAPAGSAPLTLTINGTGFVSSSTVTYNGIAHAVSFMSATQLAIPLSATDLATAGGFPVIVTNPAPGGGNSQPMTFSVIAPLPNPLPTITSLSPASLSAGSTPTTLTISGTGFIPSSSVTFNGNSHTVSFQNSSQLSIALTASDLANAGTFAVIVSNPPPGGGNSQAFNFTVTASSKTLSFNVGINPTALAFDLTNVWVANFSSNTVTKLRASDGTVIGTYPAGPSPNSLAFDGANIWVANSGTSFVTKLRASDGTLLGTYLAVASSAAGLAFDGSNIWVTDAGPGLVASFVSKLRASDGTLLGTFPVGIKPFAATFDGANIWVANSISDTVTELRASDGAVLGTYAAGLYPAALAFDGADMWVADLGLATGTLTKLRSSDGTTLGTFTVGISPDGAAFDGANIWAANYGSDTVTKLSASTGAVIATLPVGTKPASVLFDGTNIWVANYGSDTVTEITNQGRN